MGNGRARGDTALADWAGTWQRTWQGTWSTLLEPGALNDTSPIDIHVTTDTLVISHTNAPPGGAPAEAARVVLAR